MNLDLLFTITHPYLLIILGIFISSIILIFLKRVSNKTIKLFQLYPESKEILQIAFKFITWLISGAVFLLFLQLALQLWKLDFTTSIIEEIITAFPKYILAILIIISGFYVSRLLKERAKDYQFEYKNRIFVIMDFIIHMTFVFTALYSIGVNVTFFLEFYKIVLLIIGTVIAIVMSITIGIPLGLNVYNKTQKENKKMKQK